MGFDGFDFFEGFKSFEGFEGLLFEGIRFWKFTRIHENTWIHDTHVYMLYSMHVYICNTHTYTYADMFGHVPHSFFRWRIGAEPAALSTTSISRHPNGSTLNAPSHRRSVCKAWGSLSLYIFIKSYSSGNLSLLLMIV